MGQERHCCVGDAGDKGNTHLPLDLTGKPGAVLWSKRGVRVLLECGN